MTTNNPGWFTMKKAALLLILFASLLTMGCGSRVWSDTKEFANDSYDYMFDTAPTARSFHDQAEVPIIELNHRAAETLADNINWNELDRESPVYFTTFNNLGDAGDTALFGQVMTDQVVAGLVQNKVKMSLGEPAPKNTMPAESMEPETAPSIDGMAMQADNATMTETQMDEDETLVKASEENTPPQARMTGSYAIGDNYIYMRAAIVRLTDDAMVSAHNWTLPITDNIRELLPQLKRNFGMTPTVKTSFD